MAFKKLKLWFDEDLGKLLADKILEVKPDFDASGFQQAIQEQVEPLELKDRVEVIADLLFERLDKNYEGAIHTLLQILGPENEEETGMFTNFYWVMPIAKLIEKYGLDHFDLSMKAIVEITKRNTGEYTIRPYLEAAPERTLAIMESWSKDENRHVRRLASEGVRPRLPWAKKLVFFIEDPKALFPILNNLKDDPSKYVQKSVANCINDILKDNPEVAKGIIEDWNEPGASKARRWIIKHALRNLLKSGDEWASQMVQ